MKPIINPWSIYLIDLFDDLKGLFSIALFLLGCVAVSLLIIWFFSSLDHKQDYEPIVACKKNLKKSIIWL